MEGGPMSTNTTTADRVCQCFDARRNGEIDRRTLENVANYSALGKDAIDARLDQLEREWGIERALTANAATASIAGLALGAATKNRGWFLLPTAVAGLLLMQAVEGWCPASTMLRRLGFRTQREIDDERTALKALRGDFAELDGGGRETDARRAWEAARV
jgi:Protein of unknown function (DUF2892)